MLRARFAVERARAANDAEISERADGLPGIFIPRRPEVEPRFASVNAHPKALNGLREALASGAIAGLLLDDMRVITKRHRNHLLDGAGRHEAGVLTPAHEPLDDARIPGGERGPVSGEVRLLREGVHREHTVEAAAGDLRVEDAGNALRFPPAPAELCVALVTDDDRADVQAAVQACADALGGAIREHTQDWHMMQRVFVRDLDARRG